MSLAIRTFMLLMLLTTSIVTHELDAHEHDLIEKPNSSVASYSRVLSAGEEVITGDGDHLYRVDYNWLRKVEQSFHGPTHGGVAVDSKGHVYVCTNSKKGLFVLSQQGELVTTFGPVSQYLHAIVLVKESDEEVIVGANPERGLVQKFSLKGEVLLTIPNENTGEIPGSLSKVNGCCVMPDGRIVATCGYGSDKVHIFDSAGKLLKTFGGRGKVEGRFVNCHGSAYDERYDPPRLLFANRERSTLEHYTLEGEFLSLYSDNVSRPCVPVLHNEACYVAELTGRVSVFDREGKLLTRLGENKKKEEKANFNVHKTDWRPGIFTAPHGLGFDASGNLYVQDWNKQGRITRFSPIVK